MTKEEYLKIRDCNQHDVMPVLRFYHNISSKKGTELSERDFLVYFSEWLKHPLIQVNLSNIITGTFKQLDKHFEV